VGEEGEDDADKARVGAAPEDTALIPPVGDALCGEDRAELSVVVDVAATGTVVDSISAGFFAGGAGMEAVVIEFVVDDAVPLEAGVENTLDPVHGVNDDFDILGLADISVVSVIFGADADAGSGAVTGTELKFVEGAGNDAGAGADVGIFPEGEVEEKAEVSDEADGLVAAGEVNEDTGVNDGGSGNGARVVAGDADPPNGTVKNDDGGATKPGIGAFMEIGVDEGAAEEGALTVALLPGAVPPKEVPPSDVISFWGSHFGFRAAELPVFAPRKDEVISCMFCPIGEIVFDSSSCCLLTTSCLCSSSSFRSAAKPAVRASRSSIFFELGGPERENGETEVV